MEELFVHSRMLPKPANTSTTIPWRNLLNQGTMEDKTKPREDGLAHEGRVSKSVSVVS